MYILLFNIHPRRQNFHIHDSIIIIISLIFFISMGKFINLYFQLN